METGTLKELNVKPGDVVKHLVFNDGDVGNYPYNFTIDENGDARSNLLQSWFRGDSESTFGIISRADASEEATPRTWGEMTDSEKGNIPQHYRDDPTNPLQFPFVEMSRIGQGALLLAAYEGKDIVQLAGSHWLFKIKHHPWKADTAYRTRPEPKRETVTLIGGETNGWGFYQSEKMPIDKRFRITFDTLDGKPDCTTIKMEEL